MKKIRRNFLSCGNNRVLKKDFEFDYKVFFSMTLK